LQKDEVQSVIVKVQTADGNTFKAFCNGNDVTSNFTLSGSEYTLTTNQTDLKDANWTVLFTEGQAANTFTYQFSQTTGGEVLVGVVPVGDTSADIKSIQEGSMTLSLTSDEAQGVILFVEPEDNMAVRIYSGETDVTSQFTYDSSSNSYMRQTTSLANETLLFVFADKNELGVANPNLLTQHIQLTGEQLGNVWMQYLDSDGADYDDAYAGNEHPYVTFTSEDKIYIKGAKPCITVPNGYTFKAYFNGQEVTDFTLENNYYVATLDESFVTDGTWVVEFKNADSGGSNEVVAVLTPDRNTPLYLTNSSGEDVLFAFLNTEIGTITKGGDYTIKVRSYNPHSWKTNLRVNGVDRTADLVTNSEDANEMLLPLTNITESLNVEAFYTSRRSIVSLYTTEGGTTKIEYTDNETGEAASRTYSNGDYSNDRIVNGTEVIFTFTPDQGYKLSKVFAMSDRWIGEGDDYEVKLQADGSYRFVLSSGDFIDGLASITVHFEKKGGPYDVNNDGNITIGDVTKLVNVILGKE
jgi:hypothetical protein